MNPFGEQAQKAWLGLECSDTAYPAEAPA